MLGSIKVQASSIKETLKKQKSVLIEDEDKEKPIELDEVKIDVSDLNGAPDSKLDISMNSVIKVGGDTEANSLNTSIISVIKVNDDDKS